MDKTGWIKNLWKKLLFTAAYLSLLFVLWKLDVHCIFLTFLKVPCPGCGMTRALLSAFRLDFIQAFKYHFMFWSVPILYLFFIFDGKLTWNKKADKFIFIIIATGFGINWVYKLISTFF